LLRQTTWLASKVGPGLLLSLLGLVLAALMGRQFLAALGANIASVDYIQRALRPSVSAANSQGLGNTSARVLASLPDSPQVLYLSGIDALDVGNFETAAQQLDAALTAGELFAAGPLGMALWRLGNRDTALALWRRSEAFAWLRACASKIPDPEERIWWLEMMVAARPDVLETNWELSFSYAGDYKSCGVSPECLARLERAVSVPRPSITLVQILASRYAETGRFRDTLRIAQRTIDAYSDVESYPDDEIPYYLKAQALRYLGRRAEAVNEYRNAIARAPSPSIYRLLLADTLLEMHDYAAACEEYRRVGNEGDLNEQTRARQRLYELSGSCQPNIAPDREVPRP